MLVEKIFEVDTTPLPSKIVTYHFDPPEGLDLIRSLIARQCYHRRHCIDEDLFGLPSPPIDEKYTLPPPPLVKTASLAPEPEPHTPKPTTVTMTMEEIQAKLDALREEKHQLFQLIKRMVQYESLQKEKEDEENERKLQEEREAEKRRQLFEEEERHRQQQEKERQQQRRLATKQANRWTPDSNSPYNRSSTSSYYPPPPSRYPGYHSKPPPLSGPTFRSHYMQRPPYQRPYY